jgi:hypothetical protein
MHISTKFNAYWTSSLGDMMFSPRKTESENSLSGIGLHCNSKIKLALKLVMKNQSI